MGKVPEDVENPYDAWLYRLSGRLLPAMRATGHTPNAITSYGFACSLLARWFLWHDRIGPFVILNQLAYFFDCMDGHMARTYGMVSRFGDVYDHVTDVVGDVILAVIVWKRYRRALSPLCVLGVGGFAALLLVALGCQQQRHQDDAGAGRAPELLDHTAPLCPGRGAIRWTRFFGSGTWNLVTTGAAVYLWLRTRTGRIP